MIETIPQLLVKSWNNSCKKCFLGPNCLMNLMVFDSHMPNVDKYFIVMDHLSNPFHSNGSGICPAGAFMLLIILLGLRGKWKHLRSVENFQCQGGKMRFMVEIQDCSWLEKVNKHFLSEKCQFYDKNNSRKCSNCPELLYTVFPFFSPKELKYILLNLLTLGCFVWWFHFV